MVMAGVAPKQIANQFWDGALFGQNESRMSPVNGGPLAGEDQKVSPANVRSTRPCAVA